MDVLVEVNVGEEDSKSGINIQTVDSFIREVSLFENLKVVGLMSIPPIMTDETTQRKYFKEMYKVFVDISQKNIHNVDMKFLSMGMSDDYDIAIEEGANLVRIGSSLFGKRNYVKN